MLVWNNKALILIFVGFVVCGVLFVTIGAIFGENDTVGGISAALTGITVTLVDLFYFRKRSDQEAGIRRFLIPGHGAAFLFIPGWALGLVTVGCGIALFIESLS